MSVDGVPSGIRVTVLIPTQDDAAQLERTIRSVQESCPVQVLVMDSGSTDGSTVIARRCGVKVLRCSGERGRQLRLGLASAVGDVMLIVTPGTLLNHDSLRRLQELLTDAQVIAGVLWPRCERGHWRSLPLNVLYGLLRMLGVPPMYSPVFVWRTACHGINNFRSLRVFAEQDLLRRLAGKGRIEKLLYAAEFVPGHELHRLLWTLMQIPHRMRLSVRTLQWLYHKPKGRLVRTVTAEQAAQASRSSDLTISA